MWQWIKNRCSRSRRWRPPVSAQPAQAGSEAEQNARTLRAARQLCAAIDRGAQLGLWDHVERLAESAAKLAWFDAPLAERLARIKMAQGEPETALAILDRGVNAPRSLRLLRVMCQIRSGARMDAQLALADWARHGDVPIDGRLLAALLEWHAGEITNATHMLRDAAHQADDEHARWAQLMLVLIAAAQGQWDRATARAKTLIERDEALTEREMAITLDSLRLGTPIDPEQQRHERIEQMASDLPTHAHLIEPLVEAQRRQLDVPVAEELLEALRKAFAVMGEHQASAAEGIARLNHMLGERDQARTWAKRGLALNPMSARLVMLLNELGGRDGRKEQAA
jgi:tetratricopeptide (TPR) repeat protein